MKKIFLMLLILTLIYLGVQIGFHYFGNGHEYEYQVTTNNVKFNIKEKFVNNTKNELNSYYFEISHNDITFYYQTLNDFGKKDHIIENVYSYTNKEYSCILPVFKDNKIITDIMCLKENKIYYYHDMKQNGDIKSFADSLKEYAYDVNNWYDISNSQSQKNITIYPENIINEHHIGLANYKGIYIINPIIGNNIENISLFKSDIYKRPLSMFFNKYYITVNYNEQYRFTKILTVDLSNNKTKEIDCETEISFDSYIQGTYDNSIYIFDRNTKKQYEVNLKTNRVLEVGNETSGIIVYKNNEKNRIPANDAKTKDILFEVEPNISVTFQGYSKVDLIGGKETGYYYLYQKNGDKYNVYRANVKNIDQLTYIFSTTDLNRILYHNQYVYFLDGDIIKYYSDMSGVRSILSSRELSFNNSLIFGIYVK